MVSIGENTEDEVLILKIRFADQFLETFPVLSGIVGLDISVYLGLFDFILDIAGCI